MPDNVTVFAAHTFAAARKLDALSTGHKAAGRHGHDFVAHVGASTGESQWAAFPGDEPAFLTSNLAQCIAPLDYADLNEIIDSPSNENLARYVKRSMHDVPQIESVGIQCAQNSGLVIDDSDQVYSWQAFRFEAAHQLPNVPANHKCGRMHGHSFRLLLHKNGNDDEWSLERLWRSIEDTLDHACLNDIAGLENPTSEMIATWIWNQVKSLEPALSCVTVREGVNAGCHFDGCNYRIWKDSRFESAIRLQQAPGSDSRRGLHGHSYLARFFLAAPLDDVLGWTVDYGDVKRLFSPVYKQLDHHAIDDEKTRGGGVIGLSHWLRQELSDVLPALYRIDLFETPGCGASLSWGPRGPLIPLDPGL